MDWPLAVLLLGLCAVASISSLGALWLRLSAATAVRAEARDERDLSAIASLTKRCEAAEVTVAKMVTDWKAFQINHARPR